MKERTRKRGRKGAQEKKKGDNTDGNEKMEGRKKSRRRRV